MLHQSSVIGFSMFCIPLISQIEKRVTGSVIAKTVIESLLYLGGSILYILIYYHVKSVKKSVNLRATKDTLRPLTVRLCLNVCCNVCLLILDVALGLYSCISNVTVTNSLSLRCFIFLILPIHAIYNPIVHT